MDKHKKIIRGALLGCGNISLYHLTAWAVIEGVEIVALANRTIERAVQKGNEFGISTDHIYSDHRILLNKEIVDFVDIATAPHVHRMQVEDAADAGVNVLCQKPYAPTMEDALSMLKKCEDANVLFSINDNWRWRSWYREIKDLLTENIIGKPKYIRIVRHANVTLPHPDGKLPALFNEQPYTKEMEKLIVYEWGIHLIDVLRFLFGEVKSIYARMDKISDLCIGEDRALMLLDVAGVNCVVDISWASVESTIYSSPLEEVVLEGDKGTLELLPVKNLIRVTTANDSWERKAFQGTLAETYQASYTESQQHFVDCLREGKSTETEASDNIKTLETTLAAYDSNEKNQVVFLNH